MDTNARGSKRQDNLLTWPGQLELDGRWRVDVQSERRSLSAIAIVETLRSSEPQRPLTTSRCERSEGAPHLRFAHQKAVVQPNDSSALLSIGLEGVSELPADQSRPPAEIHVLVEPKWSTV